MKTIELQPLTQPVEKTVYLPGSKSYTNRALLMAALTKGSVTLHHPLYCEDTEAMMECLKKLGLKMDSFPEKIIVHDDISTIKAKDYEFFARDSGTTIRFLLALLCLIPGVKILRGSDRLNERPIRPLVEGLRQLGADIEYLGQEGYPPLKIKSSSLQASEVIIEGGESSQYVSALLMIAPWVGALTITVMGKQISKPYIDITMDLMATWGVQVQNDNYQSYYVPARQSYQKINDTTEGDYSSAGYFFAIAALTKSTLTLQNLNPNSKQGDVKFLKILESMGSQLKYYENSITIQGNGVCVVSVNMESCPDQVQTMAVLAAFADGCSVITGIRSLRIKETERIIAIKNELTKMGIKTEDTEDSLTIYGGHPHAATIDTYHDHRMAMAFAVAGAILKGIKINHPEVVNKTFPTFWEKLEEVGIKHF